MRDYSQGRHIRFAVIDIDKSKNYPANYVCTLPLQPSVNGKANNIFSELFGNDSLELAKKLLTKAFKTENDSEIKAEITRRLHLLESNPIIHIKCRVCKKFFQTQKQRALKQKVCPECMKRFAR